MKSSSRPNCSIAKGPFCINKKSINEMDGSFKNAYKQYIEMMYPEVTKNASECVKTVFLSDYWALKTTDTEDEEDEKFGLYLFLAVATGAIVIIAILLLFIYIKRKSGESEDEQLEEIDET